MSSTTQLEVLGAGGTSPATLDQTEMLLAARVGGLDLAEEVEEYFERGARVERGDLVLDIGAVAAAVAARTGSDVTIHCFEPAAPIFAELQRSFARIDELGATRHELHVLLGCGAAWPSIRSVAVETDERDERGVAVIALFEREGFQIISCAPPRIAARGDAEQLLIVAERARC